MSEHPNQKLLKDFYDAFTRGDGESMAAAYHADAKFDDAVFKGLDGVGAGAMWRMLTERGKDLKLEVSGIEADETSGKAHWEAWYTFSATGRKVHNIIDAEFEFRDGKISRHKDSFEFHRWSKMALGPVGTLFGWTGFLQRALSKKAMSELDRYREKRGI